MPTSPSWYRYIKESDDVAKEMETDIKLLIKRQAKEACQLMKDDMYKQDVWLWDLDWTPTELKVKKAKLPKKQKDQGGFQLEFISKSRVINHMTCYRFECSHWWKIYSKKKSFTRFAFQSECCNFNQ